MKRSTFASLAAATALLAGTLVAAPAWADPTSDCTVISDWTGSYTGDDSIQTAINDTRGSGRYGVLTLSVSGTCHGFDASEGPGIVRVVGAPGATIVGDGGGCLVINVNNQLTLTNLAIDGTGYEHGICFLGQLTLINVTVTGTSGSPVSPDGLATVLGTSSTS